MYMLGKKFYLHLELAPEHCLHCLLPILSVIHL